MTGTAPTLPWPDVTECHGHPNDDALCAQCDGAHEHRWVEGPRRPGTSAIPVRCAVCGARKCDVPECWERRHHRAPHVSVIDGHTWPVGGDPQGR